MASQNVTWPDATAAPFDTAAVSVTAVPAVTEEDERVSVVVVAWGVFTVKLTEDEELDRKFPSVEYTAVRPSSPAGSVVSVREATPDELRFAVPREFTPFMKVMVHRASSGWPGHRDSTWPLASRTALTCRWRRGWRSTTRWWKWPIPLRRRCLTCRY